MTPIFIVRYHKTKPARAFASTYSEEVAREICGREETHGSNWFLGWTRNDSDIKGANVHMLPLAEDCLKDIYRNPGKQVTT